MSTILDNIICNKKNEVERLLKANIDFSKQITSRNYDRSIVKNILSSNTPGIIAEFKRQSPSKGIINSQVMAEQVVKQYEEAGAVAASILTDHKYFGGSIEDIINSRKKTQLPILRKDFIIDPIQIDQAAAIGADVILLIASALTKKEIYRLTQHAQQIGLEVLLEVHEEKELEKACSEIDLLGVNNRDLHTFNIDYKRSKKLLSKIGNDFIAISESGLSQTEVVSDLYTSGFKGFLMGENFMKTTDPGRTCKEFIQELKS
ncbi:MAG: indole-3-glycerol phosphate synthase TrpC [Prolixibacteraceae bacterium]